MKEFFLDAFLLIFLLELAAALSGLYYLNKVKDAKRGERLMVMYLWLVLFVEIVGLYPAINYFTNFRAFPFVEGTLFERNYWWYNSYALVKFLILLYYFIWQLKSRRTRKFYSILTILFIFVGALNLFLSNEFFTANLPYLSIGGTLMLVILIFIYYFETLESARIMNFYRIPAFYFSVGFLIWHLTITPLFIYSHYFTLRSPEFVELHTLLLRLANIILYSFFILGWLIGAKYRSASEEVIIG